MFARSYQVGWVNSRCRPAALILGTSPRGVVVFQIEALVEREGSRGFAGAIGSITGRLAVSSLTGPAECR